MLAEQLPVGAFQHAEHEFVGVAGQGEAEAEVVHAGRHVEAVVDGLGDDAAVATGEGTGERGVAGGGRDEAAQSHRHREPLR